MSGGASGLTGGHSHVYVDLNGKIDVSGAGLYLHDVDNIDANNSGSIFGVNSGVTIIGGSVGSGSGGAGGSGAGILSFTNHLGGTVGGSQNAVVISGGPVGAQEIDANNSGGTTSSGGQGYRLSNADLIVFNNTLDGTISTFGDGVYASAANEATLTNYGHIESFSGSALDIQYTRTADIENHSLLSSIGYVDGAVIGNTTTALVDNSNGLLFGRTGAGVDIYDVGHFSGGNAANNIATVFNSGGVIVGAYAGVNIENVWNSVHPGENDITTDIRVGNSQGLILATSGDGVYINNYDSSGSGGNRFANVKIDNEFTRNSSFNYLATDLSGNPIYDQDSELASNLGVLHDRFNNILAANFPGFIDHLSNSGGGSGGSGGSGTALWVPNGIFGTMDGINVRNLSGGSTFVDNTSGVIGGYSGDGIHVSHTVNSGGSGGDVKIYNASGMIYSYESNGVHTYDIGSLWLDNANGVTSGEEDGVHAAMTSDYVYIDNYGGLIEGRSFSGDGIHIWNVKGANALVTSGGLAVSAGSLFENAVYIANFYNTGSSGGPGNAVIQGGDNGIYISHVSGGDIWIEGNGLIQGRSGNGVDIRNFTNDAYVDNYSGGRIEGSDHAIRVSSPNSGGTYIYNSGGSVVNHQSGRNTIWAETNGFVEITNQSKYSGGSYIGHDTGSGTTAELANLKAIHVDSYSSGGYAYADIANIGYGAVITGQVHLTNNNDVFYNVDGAVWNTGGDNDWGASNGSGGPHFSGSPFDQTFNVVSGGSSGPVSCTYGNCLYNNYAVINVFGNTQFKNLDLFSNSQGIINMQDGTINTLEVSGSSGGPTFYSTSGYGDGHLAVDVNLISGAFNPGEHDLFKIDGFTDSGGTAVTVHDLLPGTMPTYDPTHGIPIVQIVGSGSGDAQTFYLENGPIQKGFWQYALEFAPSGGQTVSGSDSVSGDDEWQLVMQPGQASSELPTLMTAIQSVGVNTLGLWLDRQADLRAQLGGDGPSADLGDGHHVKPTADVPGMASISGGVWTKLLAGQANRDSSTIYNGIDYDTSYNQSLFGFLSGIDFAHADGNGGTWFIGPMAGYTSANTNFGGGASAGLTAFTVGGYLTYLNGGLHVDTVAKADLGSIDYKLSGDSDNLATTSLTASAEAGYRISSGGRGFFEPMAAFAYSHTSIADGTVLGSTISFGDGNSYRAQAGLRAGFTTYSAGNKIEPFIMAAIVDDFGSANLASVTTGLTTFSFSDPGLGMYAQFGAGVNVFTSTNMSAFAKADAVVASGYNSFTGQAGVRWNW